MRAIRPLLLISNTALVCHNKTDDDYVIWEAKGEIAYAQGGEQYMRMGEPMYTIHIGVPQAIKFYTEAKLSRFFSFEAYYNGLIIHEVSHIRFGTVPTRYSMNKLKHWLWNILVDTHDEYWMGVYHPEYIVYLQALLAVLKVNSPISEEGDLQRDLDTFYYLTRFGLLIDSYDSEFAGLCWPLIHASTTNLPQDNLYQALEAVYLYLALKYKDSSAFQEAAQDYIDPEEGTQGEDTSVEGVTTLSGFEKVEERDMQGVVQQLSHGKLPGLAGVPIVQGERAAAFVRETLEKDYYLIQDTRNKFLMLWGEPAFAPAFEGEVNWQMQQQLYIDSFTHEENRNYSAPLEDTPSLKLAISRDTSSSTSGVEIEYARAAVITLAALSDIDGVEIAEVDFNTYAFQNLACGESVSDLLLAPLAAGGTSMYNALEKLFALDWSGAEIKLHLVITDGYIESPTTVFYKLNELKTQQGVETIFIELVARRGQGPALGYVSSWPGSFASTVEDLPKNIFEYVIKRLLAQRGGICLTV